jgi:branched-subunit amino acid transport protein
MSVALAVVVVGCGSLLLRAAPLLGADRLPDRLSRLAGWAGLAVLAAIAVRSVAAHREPGLPVAPLIAPLIGLVALGTCLLLAHRGRSLLVSTAAGAGAYLVLACAAGRL